MSLYDMMTNINNIDYLTTLDNIIKEIREEYKDLDETQTCKIYSGLLSDRLNNLHIPNRIINTTKLQYVTSDIESYEFNVFNTFYDAHHIIKK